MGPVTPAPCDIHDVVEGPVHPFRCSHCGRCFICEHTLTGYEVWTCPDGRRIRTLPDRGWEAGQPLPKLAAPKQTRY